MQHLETLEADLRAPSTKIFSTIVERVTEFDQHVQGHQQTKEVLTSSIVNKSFNGDERPTRAINRPIATVRFSPGWKEPYGLIRTRFNG